MADATNKIAIVTGAGTGVGRAASLALMNAGFTVVVAGRRMEMLEETKKLGDNVGKSLCVSADMTSPASMRWFRSASQASARTTSTSMGRPTPRLERIVESIEIRPVFSASYSSTS